MEELLYLCTKNVHFTLNSKTYVQIDGVTMGSPLGSILANIFMVELEQNIIPKLSKDVSFRGGSRTAATSKMERFVIIVNGFQPLTIITKCSILDVAAVLDPPLSLWKRYVAQPAFTCSKLTIETLEQGVKYVQS